MSLAGYQTQKSNTERRQNKVEWSPFDDLATEYDAWFDKDGSLIFFIEVQVFKSLMPSLPKPWLEIGVGSGRFAQALGIETGIDPSIKLIEMASRRPRLSRQGWTDCSYHLDMKARKNSRETMQVVEQATITSSLRNSI
jgi:tRNA G46 methylase TrmB